MSLLSDAMEAFIIINASLTSDGYGGIVTTYSDGATISGAMVFDTSKEISVAKALGSTSVYTLTTAKNINLQYHTILRRVSDNKIFRVTSDGDDSFTPASATLNMRQVTCEEWSLPSE